MAMGIWSASSLVSALILRSISRNPRSLCSQAEPPTKPVLDSDSPPQNLYSSSDVPNETSPEPHLPEIAIPGCKDSVSTQADVISSLLSRRNDPDSALQYFKWAERRRGLVRSIDSMCILLHILTKEPRTRRQAQYLLNQFASGDSGPTPCTVVDHLVQCPESFSLERDSLVFDYLLNSYVRAGRLDGAVDCLNSMVGHGVFPSVPFVNIVLSELVKSGMIREAHNAYYKMVANGMEGDGVTVKVMMRGCLKEGRDVEAMEFFVKAKEKGIGLDAVAYSICIQAVCRKPDVKLACELLSEMKTRMGSI
ncbi:unnamed protein product [Linum tenue]|uniref:Pentatricopeptide repeat-containing protein n=1 Tax=Linum tenue TaxID=586396 RepID=A0AAV0QHD6_9ROSI|nr:unnamed protein product [Linum tenue]